jgi:pimeloyl-ACP methyl ester carboxylesterase
MITQPALKTGRITTEGDDLYYEVRGQGQPLLMIAGGGGDGWWYIPTAERLANEYKVILYDRRANARSTMNHPDHFDIAQQSRDAVAVLHAAGETSAFVFGNSSGAIIALDMAVTQPQAVRAVIAHEPPLARVHPHAAKWQRFFADVVSMGDRFGASLAALRFLLGAGMPFGAMMKGAGAANAAQKQSGEPIIASKSASKFLIKQEMLPVTNYLVDIERIKQNGVKVFMAVGSESLAKKRFYAENAPILAKQLDAELVTFPGHHISFYDKAEEWTAVLRDVLHRAGKGT